MPAPASIDEFLALARQSNVLDPQRLSHYLRQFQSSACLPTTPAKLAGHMVRDGLLTPFQAQRLLEGKWRGFIMSGKYRVLEHVGSGGMGKVYLCEHLFMKRRVALKVLPAAQAQDAGTLERFYREARAAATLSHPNIVRAYDIDQEDNHHFLVMEYVDGSSLEEVVEKHGPLVVPRACHYIRQAAHGLQRAHKAGLVHRDIKPANLLVDRQGVVKILDMGLARFFHDQDDHLTHQYESGAVLGTADYLAPEQAVDSHSVDIRADIYSLGATFYFLLTGQSPFKEGTAMQKLLWHQVRTVQPVRELRPEVPAGAALVLEKMMAKDPAVRYQLPAEVSEALAPWTKETLPPPEDGEMPLLCPALRGVSPAAALLADSFTAKVDTNYRSDDTEVYWPQSSEAPLGSSGTDLPSPTMDPRTGVCDECGPTLAHSRTPLSSRTQRDAPGMLPVRRAGKRRWLWAAGLAGLVLAGSALAMMLGGPASKAPDQQERPNQVEARLDPGSAAPKRTRNRDPIPVRPPDTIVLRLTDGGYDESRSAFFTTAVNVETFTTQFTFRIARESNGADGFTFCIQGNDATCLGGWCWGLGYVGIGKSVAIKFDLWDNGGGEGINSTGLFTNGAPPVGAASVPFEYGIDLHSGNTYKTMLSYNGKSLTLKVTDVADPAKTFSKTFEPLDIPNLVGGPTAFVGFTGATGGASAIQEILDWTWSATGASAGMAYPNYANGFSSVGLTLNGGAEFINSIAGKEESDTPARAVGEVRRLFGHEAITRVAFAPAGHHVLSMNQDGTVALWDWDCGLELGRRPAQGHQGTVESVAFSPDGALLVSSGADTTVRLWDVHTSKEIHKFEGHGGGVCCALFSPDGRQVLSGSEDKSARLWDAQKGKTLRSFQGHSGAVKSVAFSPDGKQLLTASADRTIRLWDAATGLEVKQFEGHAGPVNGVAFTPQGDQLLSCSDDKTLRLWDVKTGALVRALQGAPGPVRMVVVAPDGRQALSAGPEPIVRYWDLQSGQLLQTLEGHAGAVTGLAFSRDGRQGFSSSLDKTLRTWQLPLIQANVPAAKNPGKPKS